jgi:hypothetical protein
MNGDVTIPYGQWYRDAWAASPLAMKPRSKVPLGKGWTTPVTRPALEATLAHGDHNLGLLLGAEGGDLIDLDIDADDALAIAAAILPPTVTYGRKSRPVSHYIYRTTEAIRGAQFEDAAGKMIIEVRGTGQLVLVPPSIHPSGEQVSFTTWPPPPLETHEAAALRERAAIVASVTLLVRAWREGSRHHLALAVAGALLRVGVSAERVAWLVQVVATCAHDNESAERLVAVRTTEERLRNGETATGAPTLAELMGAGNAARVIKWLGASGAYDAELPGDTADLDERYAYVRGSNIVWDERLRARVPISSVRHEHGPAGHMWMNSATKRTVDRIEFAPGAEPAPNVINTFKGLALKADGSQSCPCILAHIELLADGEQGLFEWFLRWLAYPLQHLGAKMQTAVLIRGKQGGGKSVLGDIMLAIYGNAPKGYGVVIGQADLESTFNDWMSDILFVVGEEVVSRQGRGEHKNPLKHLVTGKRVRINPKNLPAREEANHANFLFLSNELTPLPLDADDRRFTVIGAPAQQPKVYYDALFREVRDGGASAFLGFLMGLDLGDFGVATPPHHTAEKERVIEGSLSPEELFLRAWHSGAALLREASADEAYRACVDWCRASGWEAGTRQRLMRLIGERPDLIERKRDRTGGHERLRYAPVRGGGGGGGAEIIPFDKPKQGAS